MSEDADCIVIGGGPAGLTAATYLRRYHRAVLLLSQGPSRAQYIARTQNMPGYPGGLAGGTLLDQLQRQARRFGCALLPQRALRISGEAGAFRVDTGQRAFSGRTVLLCSGVEDRLPDALAGGWDAVGAGSIRLCPVCDAFEYTDAALCVLGSSEKAGRQALFLRGYSPHLTLLTDGVSPARWSAELRQRLAAAGVHTDERRITRIVSRPRRTTVTLADGDELAARALYVSLGCNVRSELATALGARCDEDGFLHVDQHQQTSVPGLYAAGDVVQSLSQIAVAFGQAAIAATAIHNRLREATQPQPPGRSDARPQPPPPG
ncbi:MAG: NAD(P)/FAD-dependent oxidoreductase [Polyangia bacterium]